jgi:hypothetical protein
VRGFSDCFCRVCFSEPLLFGVQMSTATANKRAGGKGGFTSLCHTVRPCPALPQHQRSANTW